MVSRYFESMPYRLDESTGQIDYDQMEKSAELFRPKLIVAGASAYSRLIDYERIRKIADSVGAYVSEYTTKWRCSFVWVLLLKNFIG